MRALVVSEPGKWSITELPVPEPGPGEVLVAPKAAGICGTDLHILAGEFPPTPYPIVPGHEFAGLVAAVGEGVSNDIVGKRVAVDPSLFCGSCRYCQAGRGNLCEHWGAIGDTVPGGFAEYVAVPRANAYPMPGSMSFTAGALVEPMSCVVHALERLDLRVGSELLIIGGGTMGLSILQVALRSGATQVDVVDTDSSRLRLASKFGAHNVSTSASSALEPRDHGYEYVVEATGAPAALQDALLALDRGGTLLVLGVAPESARVSVSPFTLYNSEQSVTGTMAVLNSFGRALRLVAARVVDARTMVTHTFGLDDFDKALDAVRQRAGLKVQITLP